MNTRRLAASALGAAVAAGMLSLGGSPSVAAPSSGPAAATTQREAAVGSVLHGAGVRLAFEQRLARRGAGAARVAGPTARPVGLPADGAFVRDPQDGTVYRVVGRSLVYVSTWAPFGGPQRVTTLTETMWDQARRAPADGTFVTSIQERRVYRFVAGAPIVVTTWAAFGGKAQRTIGVDSHAISQAGRCQYDEATFKYCFVRSRPDDVRVTLEGDIYTFDHTARVFIRGGQDGRVYRLAGDGAPLYVDSWAPYGGPTPTVTVDSVAIDRAGQAGPFSHLRATPKDTTVLRDPATGQVFTIIGGAPVYVSHPAALRITSLDGHFMVVFAPGAVNRSAIDRAGQNGPWRFLRYRPEDGVKLLARPTGNSYRVIAGAPEATGDGDSLIDEWMFTADAQIAFVGQATIDRAGQPGQWSHLQSPPS